MSIRLAQRLNGEIVNADSMQVYKDVPTLTARPDDSEKQGIPHHLFGFLDAGEKYSVVRWLEQASLTADKILERGGVPVVTGGTGMYLDAFMNGINEVPEVPLSVRTEVNERFEKLGKEAFLNEYLTLDPSFRFVDKQRLCRAAEVLKATGKTLREWQKAPKQKAYDADFYTILILPPRPLLYERCDKRFDLMMKRDVFSEVKALFDKKPPFDAGVLKAVGVRELKAVSDNEISLEEAVENAKRATRRYAKRQITWFSHRFIAKKVVFNENFDEILTNVLRFLQ